MTGVTGTVKVRVDSWAEFKEDFMPDGENLPQSMAKGFRDIMQDLVDQVADHHPVFGSYWQLVGRKFCAYDESRTGFTFFFTAQSVTGKHLMVHPIAALYGDHSKRNVNDPDTPCYTFMLTWEINMET